MKKNKLYQVKERVHFDKLAEDKGEIWWGSVTPAGIKRLKRRAELVFKSLRAVHNPRVLELGCGTGAFSKHVLEGNPSLSLTCCDISKKCVEIASLRYSRYKNACFEVKDILSEPYPSNTFDCIIGNSVLHHLPADTVLKDCYRILKSGGDIIFFEPNMMNPQIMIEKNIGFIGKILEDSEDETAFFRWSLKRILYRMGFEKIIVQPFDFLHPSIPAPLVDIIDKVGRCFEKTPVLKEISGSLFISAHKAGKREG